MFLVIIVSLVISLIAMILLWRQSNNKLVIIVTGIILFTYLLGAIWNGYLVAVNSHNYKYLGLSGMLKDVFGTIEIPFIFTILFSSLKNKD